MSPTSPRLRRHSQASLPMTPLKALPCSHRDQPGSIDKSPPVSMARQSCTLRFMLHLGRKETSAAYLTARLLSICGKTEPCQTRRHDMPVRQMPAPCQQTRFKRQSDSFSVSSPEAHEFTDDRMSGNFCHRLVHPFFTGICSLRRSSSAVLHEIPCYLAAYGRIDTTAGRD